MRPRAKNRKGRIVSMAMNPKCATAVRAAAGGRQISEAKLAAIEDAISGTMRELARRDRQRWQGLTRDQRMAEAMTAAMEQIQAEAAIKEYRASLQVLRTAEAETRITESAALSGLTRSGGLIRDIEQTSNYIDAVRNESISGLADMIDAAEKRDGTGLLRNLGMRIFDLDNPAMTADVIREVFRNADGHTGNKAAIAGARAWLDVIEAMRQRFNAAGGSIGKLGYGYLSQAHDAVRVSAAGADGWARKVLPMLDREQYVRADGSLMNDGEVFDLLRGAWQTISSEGDNKVAPGQFKGTGARANRGSEHRVLHFRDGEAWMGYMNEFGEGSLYDAMVGHVGAMARDIGLVERYGPNPEQLFRVQDDIARRADGQGTMKSRLGGNSPQAYWDLISGKATMPQNLTTAAAGQNLRNIQTAAKLGGAVLSSTTDIATVATTLHYNRLPYFSMLTNLGRQFSADQREFLQVHGIIGEALTSTLNRWTGDHLTHSLTGRVAGSVMKLSLMNAWTDGLRGAFSATMMQSFTKKLGKAWGELDEWDQYLMQRKGITADDWAVISKATTTERNGVAYLTGDGIRNISDADVMSARSGEMQAISDRIRAQTAELSARNAQDQQWIRGRIDKFDEARDAMNRWVKSRQAKRLLKNEAATGPMLERMAMLDAQREQAQMQADMEADFNRFATQDEMRAFLNAVEDGASADLVDVGGDFGRGGAKSNVRLGLQSAEAIGRRYGEAKGRLERRMREIENRISQMDRESGRAANADAKAIQKKAEEMANDLADFVKRSQERQERRRFVIDRLMAEEGPSIAAEANRLRSQAATKWLAFVQDEAQFAVINPDLATRAIVTGGAMPAGTIKGEAVRSFMQFKSFPIAMLTRHWRRVFEAPQGLEGAPVGFGADSARQAAFNRTAVLAGLNVSLMMLGAVVLQNKALVQGKDPYDMTEGKFWMRALTQGGGLGYVGDLVFKDPTEQRANTAEQTIGTVLGPGAGAVAGLVGDVGIANAWEAAKGKDTKFVAESLRWVNAQTPYVGLWQVRGIWEHWFLHNLQDAANPGYLSRMKARAQKDWGQGYWWEPGEFAPDRAPDFERMTGE